MAEDDRSHEENIRPPDDAEQSASEDMDPGAEPWSSTDTFRIDDRDKDGATSGDQLDDVPVVVPETKEELETPVEEAHVESVDADSGRRTALAWTLTSIAIVFIGIALQIGYYWRNRALWLDEADLAMNILGRSFGELFQPLADNQSAPLGFLLLVKSMVTVFGIHEYVFRALPLASGIIGVVLVYYLARKVLDPAATTVAVTVCAVSFPIIRYASELKQYATDFAFSALILLAALHLTDRPLRIGGVIGFAIVGFIAIWFSHASVFVLAGTGLVLGVHAIFAGEWKRALSLVVIGVSWFAGFAIHYLVLLRHYQGNEALRSWHVASFAPIPPWTPTAAKWYVWTFVEMFEHPLGLLLSGLGVFAFVVGVGVMARKVPLALAAIMLPGAIALGASAIQLYPFTERFLLFFAPSLALLVGAGTAAVVRMLWPRARWVAIVFVILLFIQPAMVAANEIRKPPWEGVRPAVDYLAEHLEPDDHVYVYHWVRNAFQYYVRKRDTEIANVTVGVTSRNDWSFYRDEIENLRGNDRVWFLINEAAPHLQHGEPMFFRTTLDTIGARLDERRWGNAMLYLYDLSSVEESVSAPARQQSMDSQPPVETQPE